ncbi:hypothetical protein F4776DRAFT_616253 [Hypoxylon sp. NC0597]|nr:hypothetical protein F4776DRAFT_616253 [Hypoxylon sp. NC0597]
MSNNDGDATSDVDNQLPDAMEGVTLDDQTTAPAAPAAPPSELRPLPPPTMEVPKLPTISETVNADWKFRAEYRGSWYLKDLDLTSRYYGRETAERMFQSAGDESDPIDLLLVIKDVQKYDHEELLGVISKELEQGQPYSRDYNPTTNKFTRLHANPAGREHLLDVDRILEQIRKFERELRRSDETNAATDVFSAVCQAYNWDPASIRDAGFHQDFMYYASFFFVSRLRFMRDQVIRNQPKGTNFWEIVGIPDRVLNVMAWEFSNRIHSPNLRGDILMIDWYTNWAGQFSIRESDAWARDPRLSGQDIKQLFQRSYEFHVPMGIILLANDRYTFDVEIIESWLAYRAKWKFINPMQKEVPEAVHREWYIPWVTMLQDTLRPEDEMTPDRLRRYQDSCVSLRDDFVEFVDQMQPIHGTIGRWSRMEQPASHATGSIWEEEARTEAKWTKGWYCVKHRPYHGCLTCGHIYSCAVCANPYTCAYCKTPWSCTECGERSYDPATDQPQYLYRIAKASLAPGFEPQTANEDGTTGEAFRMRARLMSAPRHVYPLSQWPGRPAPAGGWSQHIGRTIVDITDSSLYPRNNNDIVNTAVAAQTTAAERDAAQNAPQAGRGNPPPPIVGRPVSTVSRATTSANWRERGSNPGTNTGYNPATNAGTYTRRGSGPDSWRRGGSGSGSGSGTGRGDRTGSNPEIGRWVRGPTPPGGRNPFAGKAAAYRVTNWGSSPSPTPSPSLSDQTTDEDSTAPAIDLRSRPPHAHVSKSAGNSLTGTAQLTSPRSRGTKSQTTNWGDSADSLQADVASQARAEAVGAKSQKRKRDSLLGDMIDALDEARKRKR